MKVAVFLSLLLVPPAIANAQLTGNPHSLRDVLASTRAAYGLPAIAGAVIRSDRVLDLDALGVARLGAPDAVVPQDRFHLGSITKSMTATLVALLVDEGRLEWETPIARALSGAVTDVHSDYRSATVEQLLSHRAGLPPFTSGSAFVRLPA